MTVRFAVARMLRELIESWSHYILDMRSTRSAKD